MKEMERHSLSILSIIMISAVSYANTLMNGFVYDDATTIVGNLFIKDLSNLPDLSDKELYFRRFGEMSYRPVATLTYFLDYAVYGLEAWGFHLSNLLLHTINGILLYIFLWLLFSKSGREESEGGSRAPLLASLLFINHPVLTESVNAVSFREDLLVFLFCMATLNLYLVLRTKPVTDHRLPTTALLYLLSCLTYFLALLSKEMAVTLPLIVYCYEWFYSKNKGSLRSILPNPYNMGYIGVTFVYLYIRFYLFYNPVDIIVPQWQLSERLTTLPLLLLDYLKLILFPVSLSADYNIVPVEGVVSSSFIGATTVIASCLAVILLIRKTEPVIAFGVFFLLIALLPVYNIVPLGNPFAERYLYFPMAGFSVAIGPMIYKASSLFKGRPLGIIAITLAMFLILTIQRNSVWRDEYSLWSDTLKKVTSSPRAHYAMGNVYASKGMPDEAVGGYKESIRLSPYYPDAFNALGLAYYKKAKELKQDFAGDKKVLIDDAVIRYKKALEIDPEHRDARNNLALLYYEQGRAEEAINEYIILLRYRPDDFEALNGLGLAFFQKGFFEKALLLYRKAMDIDSKSAVPYSNIGMVYAVRGNKMEAEKWFIKAIEKDPDSAEAYYNLGFLYQGAGSVDKAAEAYKRALNIKPDYEEAKERLKELH